MPGRQVESGKWKVEKRSNKLVSLSTCLLIAIILLAAWLRLYRLDAQSLWNDEGNSARLAERTLQSITIGTASDIHPPLYYYALHFGRAIFGSSEFALRSLSVACGILLVCLIYRLGRQLFDEQTALAAALLAAINPFQIYYSQEARMYAMVALWAAASVVGVLGIGYYGRRSTFHLPLSTFYVLTAAAGLYTQYTFVFMLVVHNLIAAALLVIPNTQLPNTQLPNTQSLLRRALIWVGLQLAVVVAYLPWLPVALARTGSWGVERQSHALGEALLTVGRVLAYGVTLPTAQASIGLAAFGLLALAGILFKGRPGARLRASLLVIWWLTPIVLMFGLQLYREAYLKFLLVSSAPACLLVGRGAVSAWRAAKRYTPFTELQGGAGSPAQAFQALVGILVILALLPLLQSLSNLYFDPVYERDDYRGMARFVQSVERPDDAVLLIAPNQWEVFTYYYSDVDRVYPLARARPPDPARVTVEMSEIVAKHSRLFVLYWGEGEADPQRVYEGWLATHTFKATEQWWGRVRLAMYAAPPAVDVLPRLELTARFGNSIALDGYTLLAPQVSAGDVIQLTLFWRAVTPIEQRYKVFVHLITNDGQIIAQADREPVADLTPTTLWQPGETVVDRYGLWVPPDAAPGRYTMVIGLYDFNGARLALTAGAQGDALHLTDVQVTSNE